MSEHLSKDFWNKRYLDQQTGWDIGEVSRPIKEFFDRIKAKTASILIPGSGNAYEAEYLHNKGFTNVTVLDFAAEPLKALKSRVPDFPDDKIVQQDFFEHDGSYDFIIEQTLFCAIDPDLRLAYARKVKELLSPGGKLVGVMFNREFESGPPFGGTKEEYVSYFSPYFSKIQMEPCRNSIDARQGSELFVIIEN